MNVRTNPADYPAEEFLSILAVAISAAFHKGMQHAEYGWSMEPDRYEHSAMLQAEYERGYRAFNTLKVMP